MSSSLPRWLPYEGPVLRDDQDALDLISRAHYDHDAEWVVVPVDRLAEDFFLLRTGLAGRIVQKFVSYRMGLAVLGDVSAQVAASTAFGDYVRETNRGGQVWFVTELSEFEQRLAGHSPAGR